MTFDEETQLGRRVIHATTKALMDLKGKQHEMGPSVFTDEVQRRVELELGPGVSLPREKLEELTEILMRSGEPTPKYP